MKLIHYPHPLYRLPALATANCGGSSWPGLDREIERLFDHVGGGLSALARFPVELREDHDHAYVRAELPGVKREDIGVEVTGGNLTITAKRAATGQDADGDSQATFARSVSLGETVQTEKITAAYENGVLTVTLPKAEASKPRKITVN